jgi:2-polyprenyl-3-methyl-5-hydroxy-6-metoxy-1,4-benzoquinol methylase
LETANYPNEYFDVITAFDVIEHLKRLSDFLSTVKNILKKDGLFIILVPNYNSLLFQLDKIIHGLKKTPLPNTPEHLTYFTMDSLKRLLKKHGFQVEKILSTDANDEYENLCINGPPLAILRSVLNNICYTLGKISNRRDTILTIAKKV